MAAKRHEHSSGLADAAGRAAFIPARAAARAWRGPIEEAVDEVLSAPELARLVDRAFAGPLPEELARSLTPHRVLERIVNELVESGELERLVSAALASPRALELTDDVLASAEMERALRRVASSPEARPPSDDGARRGRCRRRPRLRGAARRARRAGRAQATARRPPDYAGLATRSIALGIDVGVTIVLFMSAVGMAAL